MALDIIEKAQSKIEEILKYHKVYELEPELEKEIDDYIESVEKRNINE